MAVCLQASAQKPLQGFFLDRWTEKKAAFPQAIEKPVPLGGAAVQIRLDQSQSPLLISPFLFGNNTNQWMGQVLGEEKLVQQIRSLSPGILRYPGGNYSNIFFWDAENGVKPADVPDTILYGDNRPPRKARYAYGKSRDANRLSLDNYYQLLQQTNSTGTICVNAGYARYGLTDDPLARAAHYAADWVRYDNGRTQYWEIGNEDYGEWQAGYRIDIRTNKDHQPEIISGTLYGRIFLAFADSMRQAAREIKATIYIGATIVEALDNREIKRDWNRDFFKIAGNQADFFVVHSYYTPYETDSSPDVILQSAHRVTDQIMRHLQQNCRDYQVDMKPVALTEWNIFAVRSSQQTSYINGLHTALVLGRLATRQYGMACRWDLVNAYNNGDDHGMFSRGDEPGIPLWNPRPDFYYMYYFRKCLGDRLLPATSTDTAVVVYASSFSDGKKGLVLINISDEEKSFSLSITPPGMKQSAYVYTLTGGTDNGLFSRQVLINGEGPVLRAGGPPQWEKIKAWKYEFTGELRLNLPARSVQYMLIG